MTPELVGACAGNGGKGSVLPLAAAEDDDEEAAAIGAG